MVSFINKEIEDQNKLAAAGEILDKLWNPNYAPSNTVDARVEFWKSEYKKLAYAGVEKMRELGYCVEPAEKMIAAAEYKENKILGKPPTKTPEQMIEDATRAFVKNYFRVGNASECLELYVKSSIKQALIAAGIIKD